MTPNTEETPIFVQAAQRPARRLILQRGKNATEYWGYCEEVGCDVWGVLCRFKEALFEPVGMWLPESLRRAGTSVYVQGVELPADYDGPIPDGLETLDLPPCTYLTFHHPPFDEDKMGQAIGAVSNAIAKYTPELYGWKWADEEAPRFQMAPMPERGYLEARPVRPIT